MFLQDFFESHRAYDQTQGISVVFSSLYEYPLLYLEVSNHNLMRQVHLPSYTGLKLLEQGCLLEWKANLNSLQGEELNREFPYAKNPQKHFAQIFMTKKWRE